MLLFKSRLDYATHSFTHIKNHRHAGNARGIIRHSAKFSHEWIVDKIFDVSKMTNRANLFVEIGELP